VLLVLRVPFMRRGLVGLRGRLTPVMRRLRSQPAPRS
jgi:hypothetical protein